MSSPTSTTPKDDGDFFDDDNNKAMYLVLPAMILIYGSCCLVYCIHKCRRYFARRTKRKLKHERQLLLLKNNGSFENAGLSMLGDSAGGSDAGINNKARPGGTPQPVVLMLENLESEQTAANEHHGRQSLETDVDSLADVLQTESVAGVNPGYTGSTLRQEMQHLDNQLKAAFGLRDQSGVKPNSQESETGQAENKTPAQTPAAITEYLKWKALQKTKPPKLELKVTPSGDTVVIRIPKEKRLKMIQEQQNKVHQVGGGEQPEEAWSAGDKRKSDIAAMLAVRNEINKGFPKSMPDIMPNPEENQASLKKISADSKRKIFLSSQ